jgi:hypothetical protein
MVGELEAVQEKLNLLVRAWMFLIELPTVFQKLNEYGKRDGYSHGGHPRE